MSPTVKKYFSFLFLLLFFFPMVEKEIHALEHAGDLHCTSDTKHFHESEHNCAICDFTFCSSDGPSYFNTSCRLFSLSFNYTPGIHSVYELNTIDHSGARAPPVV